jgi:MEMO1 family protein
VLGEFGLVPLVVGDATPEEVAQVLARLWDGPETLLVISSDLSHYEPYERARAHDAATAATIERLDFEKLGPRDACGWLPIAGLLIEARRRGMRAARLDLRNSGDTAGGRDQVVGYGAWAFQEP